MWDLWKEKREDQDSWLGAGCKWKWFENYLLGNAMCGQKEQVGLFILRKQLMIWIVCVSFKLGEFPWLWAKAFCHFCIWSSEMSVLQLLNFCSPIGAPSAEVDELIGTWLFLAACSEGAAVEEETSPYLIQDLSHAVGIQTSVSSQPQRWAEMVWCGLMLLRGWSPNQLLVWHPSEASRRTGNLWIWTLRVPVHTAVICGVLQHFLEVFR